MLDTLLLYLFVIDTILLSLDVQEHDYSPSIPFRPTAPLRVLFLRRERETDRERDVSSSCGSHNTGVTNVSDAIVVGFVLHRSFTGYIILPI